MESVLGNWLPIPQGAGDGPFPGRGLYWSRSRRARCQALRGGPPPPVRCASASPPPARRMRPLTLCVYYCSRAASPSALPGKSPQAGSLAGTCCLPRGCQHHPLSPPGLLVPGSGHSGTWRQPRLPLSLHPTSGGPAAPGLSLLSSRGCAQARVRSGTDLAGERSGLRRGKSYEWGGSKAKIIAWSHLSKRVNTITPPHWGRNRVRRTRLLQV